MRFTVQPWTPGTFVIVPEGHDPLPALFESQEDARQIADKVGQQYPAASEKVPCGDPDHKAPLATQRRRPDARISADPACPSCGEKAWR